MVNYLGSKQPATEVGGGSKNKRGGVRVIYFNAEDDRIWLLIVYAKAKFDNLPANLLAKLRH